MCNRVGGYQRTPSVHDSRYGEPFEPPRARGWIFPEYSSPQRNGVARSHKGLVLMLKLGKLRKNDPQA